MIDLRSDTVTRPTPAMREAMARAEVGDDVFGEDPTVRVLEETMAHVTGKEAALFVTSGTMGNQLAIAVQTRPGDEVVVGQGAHPVHYEAGAGAALSGVQFTIAGNDGLYTPAELVAAISPPAPWTPRVTLLSIENTHNRSGGRVWPAAQAEAVVTEGRRLGIAAHLDGARLWNASVASGVPVDALCAPFDTASLCFSKGLGAPVGSALCGSKALVGEARRLRKRWGGGMRQSGILAAGALYALAHHRERLAEDHANARLFADRVGSAVGLVDARISPATLQTNMVFIEVAVAAESVAREALALGVGVAPVTPTRIRAVFHLDVSKADAERAASLFVQAVARAKATAS
jgi:threonine aldolase